MADKRKEKEIYARQLHMHKEQFISDMLISSA